MVFYRKLFWTFLPLYIKASFAQVDVNKQDPCKALINKKWVAPSDLRSCFQSFPVKAELKQNMLDVVSKTLAFHTSVSYQVQAPPPFDKDVHEDLLADLSHIDKTTYASDYDLHIDLSRSLRRAFDGHLGWVNLCYVTAYENFVPIPVVLLTDSTGKQDVHIAPEAFNVSSVEFADEIDFWQKETDGQLESFSGAKVLSINGEDPFVAVNANSAIRGTSQGNGTRQNGFFSSYQRGSSGWLYILGQFARQNLPLSDSVTLVVQKDGSKSSETLKLSYRSRVTSSVQRFNDGASYLQNNCQALPGTNGFDINAPPASSGLTSKFQQGPQIPHRVAQKHKLNILLDSSPPSNVVLPPTLTPALPAIAGSQNVTQFYLLNDGKTGVMALGSFQDADFTGFLQTMSQGLQNLKQQGATQLIVDVSNNGGGFICAFHWLHRIIVGPKSTTVPNAGFNSTARDGPLAQKIIQALVTNTSIDPNANLLYTPIQFADINNVELQPTTNWLQPPVPKTINGRQDAFSPTLGSDCLADVFFVGLTIPDAQLFDPTKVAIVSNGMCASSCAIFSIMMAKVEGSKTVVVGGKNDVPQQYCGTVGGQSTLFSGLDTDIKSTHLKSDPLAPPDMLGNTLMGVAWRLAYGITGVDDSTQPEEWQDHPADLNLPLTKEIVNNPVAIWQEVVKRVLS